MLASISAHLTVKLWDIEKGSEAFSLDGVHEQLIQDINWSPDGKTYATSSKDKKVRIVDARDNAVAQEIPDAHEGAKSTKLTFLGRLNNLVPVRARARARARNTQQSYPALALTISAHN